MDDVTEKRKKNINRYIPAEIEKKWQKKWEEEELYTFTQEGKKEKYYTLVELPYPSGDLHIGHWFTFVTPDVLSRYMKMKGKNVFFPMGFDAFGLPAENAAIKRNIHPKDWTMSNISSMTNQFKTMGTMIDWSKITVTCLPEYYKWNQWIFIEMYKKGIAYRGKTLSNWCPKDQTVLANEHVENGKCWRCGTEVIQKEVEQWFLKITEYAQELLWPDDPMVDWPLSVREGQNNWIGKKEGMKIAHHIKDSNLTLETFTAFPEWSFADTYIAIASEHPIVNSLVKGTPYEKDIRDFIKDTATISKADRNEEKFEKKGVFTGKYAINPFTGEDMPIWVANFVLLNFGTGAVRCSAHDKRDYEFAQKYKIPLKEIVIRKEDSLPVNSHENISAILINAGPFSGKNIQKVKKDIINWIIDKGIGKRFINYHLHDWSISRQRYWGTPVPMVHCENCGIVPVAITDLPIELPYDVDYAPKGKPPLATNEKWLDVVCPRCGKGAKRDAETLDTFFDSSWYYYRYVNPKFEEGPFDTEKIKELMPVDIYFGGAEHTLGHTLYSRFFTKFFKDLKLISFDEFAKRRIQHGIVLGGDGNKMSKSKGNVVNPDDIVKEFGTDAVRLYLAFMMPYEATAPWNTAALYGTFRFLKRVWELQEKVDSYVSLEKKDLIEMNKTIRKVTDDISMIHLNTAVAALMEWLNFLGRKKTISKGEYSVFLKLLAPFSPHITEEIWQSIRRSAEKKIGYHFSSIHQEEWPLFDNKFLVGEFIEIVIQINGKMRDIIKIRENQELSEQDIKLLAKKSEKVKKYLEGKLILNIIYIPKKVINFVISS